MSTTAYTYSCIASRSYDDGYFYNAESDTTEAYDVWTAETWIRQGSYSAPSGNGTAYHGPYYGTFDFGSAPAALAGRTVSSARIYIKRMTSGGSGTAPFTVYETPLTSIPASGAHSPDGSVVAGTGHWIASLALGQGPSSTTNTSTWYNLPVDLAEAVIAGKCLAIYSGGSYYARLEGYGSAYAPQIEITCTIPEPSPSIPTVDTITSPITDDSYEFSCSESVDDGEFFTSADLFYEWQVSLDNGSTWGADAPGDDGVITTAAATLATTIDLKTFAGLGALQYYYNATCKVRVRAVTPEWGDPAQNYYSAWGTSAAFTVDYRIAPSAPISLEAQRDGVTATEIYETETSDHISFVLGAPESYNDTDSAGDPMVLHYYVELSDGTDLADGENTTLGYTVGNLTTGDDKSVTLKAHAVDSEPTGAQTGAYLSNVPLTIKRFRPPTIVVVGTPTRNPADPTQVTATIRITDTGYGGTQDSGQIDKVQADTGAGYADVTLGTWVGLDNTFTFTLAANARCTLYVKAFNNYPAESSLVAGLESTTPYSTQVYEYLPSIGGWKNPSATGNQAPQGGYMQAGVIGAGMKVVNKGCLDVEKDVIIGNLAATEGNIIAAGAGGKLVDSGISATQEAWKTNFTYSNGWVTYTSGGSYDAGYMKDTMGFVHLKGFIKSGTIGNAYTAITLPEGYRPQQTHQFGTASADLFGEVRIKPDGTMQVLVGSATWVSLDGITFRAA